MENSVLGLREDTQYLGSRVEDLLQAGEVFRVFTQHDSELTPAGFAKKQKELGVSYGMVVVHTGSTQVDGDGLRNYELDFGVGHRYATEVVANTGSGLGGYYTTAVMRALGFRKLESCTQADYVLPRPVPPVPAPRVMWGWKPSCQSRLRPEWARLNCYCVILFKRYLPEDQAPSLELALPSLLCKYGECWSVRQEADADAPLAGRLLSALVCSCSRIRSCTSPSAPWTRSGVATACSTRRTRSTSGARPAAAA